MRVLVLCHGNINRSPLTEAILRREGIEADSAGFKNPNRRAAKKMRDAAKQLFQINLEQHRSKLVTPELYNWANVIVYMDAGNKKRLLAFQAENASSLLPRPCLNLGQWSPDKNKTRIPDPHFVPRGPDFNKLTDLIGSAANSFAHDVKAGKVEKGEDGPVDAPVVKKAQEAIDKVFNDTKVEPKETLARLRNLRTYIIEMEESLKVETE